MDEKLCPSVGSAANIHLTQLTVITFTVLYRMELLIFYVAVTGRFTCPRSDQDCGVKAFVAGLCVASSRVMIASSLNEPDTKNMAEANVCQKPYSGYITLIAQWREEIMGQDPSSVHKMFSFEL